MSRIDDENKKQFRQPMKILAGINGRDTRVTMTATPSGAGLAVYDTITTEYPHRMVADFSGGGVPLNGSRKTVPKSGEPVSDATGKTGLQTHVGAGQSVTINWALNKQIEIASITLVFDPESSGTITASTMGYSMPIAPRVVIPAGAKSGTVTITNDSDSKRAILYDMAPGISLDFTEADIVKASLALRADLSVDTQAIPTSEIELQVYWTQDISSSISNISDNASIYYQSGYPGDMSETRHFYLSEPATMADGLITIKGEDAARHLDEKKISAQVINTRTGNGYQKAWSLLENTIRGGIGGAALSSDGAPTGKNTGTESSILIPDTDARTLAADLIHVGTVPGEYWPAFVDAGIPRLTWRQPAPKWDIYEEDCGEVTRSVDRNLAAIKSGNSECLLGCAAVRSNTWTKLDERKTAEAGKRYNINPSGGPYWAYTVSNATNLIWAPERLSYQAKKKAGKRYAYYYRKKKKGKLYKCSYKTYKKKKSNMRKKKTVYVNPCIAKGKKLSVSGGSTTITAPTGRPGYTLELQPLEVKGNIKAGAAVIYPRHGRRFEISNITGQFTWKGDPRMQPRDVVRFHHTDKNKHLNDAGADYEVVQISDIELTHEAGGTQAKIAYRKGV